MQRGRVELPSYDRNPSRTLIKSVPSGRQTGASIEISTQIHTQPIVAAKFQLTQAPRQLDMHYYAFVRQNMVDSMRFLGYRTFWGTLRIIP